MVVGLGCGRKLDVGAARFGGGAGVVVHGAREDGGASVQAVACVRQPRQAADRRVLSE